MPKSKTTKTDTGNISTSSEKLIRPEKDRIVAGVCSGLGIFFQVDPIIIRIIFILITLFGGGGILLYIILWLIIPSQNGGSELTKAGMEKNAVEMRDKASEMAKEIRSGASKLNSRQILGVIVIILGIMVLLGNFGYINFHLIWKLFPAIVIIVFGIAIYKK